METYYIKDNDYFKLVGKIKKSEKKMKKLENKGVVITPLSPGSKNRNPAL